MEPLPIKQAPDDGLPLLLLYEGGWRIGAWDPETRGCEVWGFQAPGWTAWDDGNFVLDEGVADGSGFRLRFSPTYFLPLPARPA